MKIEVLKSKIHNVTVTEANVKNIDLRISEAERLGYNKIIISSNSITQNKTNQIEILKFSKLSDVVKQVFKEQD